MTELSAYNITVYRDGCVITDEIGRGCVAYDALQPQGPLLVSDRNGLADVQYHELAEAPMVGETCSVDFPSGDRVRGQIAQLEPQLLLSGQAPNGAHDNGWVMNIKEYSALTVDREHNQRTSFLCHNASADALVQYPSSLCQWIPITVLKLGREGYYLRHRAQIDCYRPITTNLSVRDQYLFQADQIGSGGDYQLGPVNLEHRNNLALSEERGALIQEYVHRANSNQTWVETVAKFQKPLNGQLVVYDRQDQLVRVLTLGDYPQSSLRVLQSRADDLDCTSQITTTTEGNRYRTVLTMKVVRPASGSWPTRTLTLEYQPPANASNIDSDCPATMTKRTMQWELDLGDQAEITERCVITYELV